MTRVTGISANATQTLRVPIADGTRVIITLTYRPAVQMWFASFTHGTFTINNMRVCNNINLLSQFQNIIPFGILPFAPDFTEPILVNDFQSGRCKLYILTAEEVQDIDAAIMAAS